jgi:Holliday junction resolvase-like predicted endonuclease
MMPPHCDDSTVSNAERKVFDLLRNDPETASWVVLHSLGLSRRAAKPYGEIDFVVLVPEGGIVCLEVKGGRVTCSDGIWYTVDKYEQQHKLKRSPFMQAREGMFALRNELLRYFGATHPAGRCLTGYAVVFPDVPSPPQTPEFEPWESIDSEALRMPISHLIQSLIKSQRKKFGRNGNVNLSPQTMREIRQFLRPDFDAVITRSVQIRRTEEKLLQLTEEQYEVLDRLSENERCLIKGPAGTGKTLLGMEFARRSAAEGSQTLFACYNRILGNWLREQTAGLDGIICGSFYRSLRELILASPFGEEFREQAQSRTDHELYNEVFPFYGELAASEANALFDTIVLDEAQDLIKKPVLNTLNAWLRGGLAGGRWAIIGDFTRQAIYTGDGENDADSLLQEYCPYYTRELLTLNCRNTRQVAEETGLLSGFFSLPYRLGRVEGLAVDYRYWRNAEHQAQILSEVIEKLLNDGVAPEDVMVLSPRKFKDSVAYRLVEKERFNLYELRERNPKSRRTAQIPFSTIHAFKGMESPVVVMCDLDTIDSEEPQALLYTGMSRTRSHLTVLLHNSTHPAIAELATRKLSEEWTR